jgi:hypothetical protein
VTEVLLYNQLMVQPRGNKRIKSMTGIAIKVVAILFAFIAMLGFVEVNNALHPPRIIPPGNTLKKLNIPYQSIDLITEDGVRLSAWYTPPRNGVVILLAHGYGDNRPEWDAGKKQIWCHGLGRTRTW